MSEYRPIDIDFDVHKKIELERQSFAETDNEVLRRLLSIGHSLKASAANISGRPWVWKGVELPHGTELRMTYNGRTHSGMIQNGRWMIGGREYSSPSSAAGALARTKAGGSPSLNGWELWEAKLPGTERWRGLKSFPRKVTRRRG
jgi:hypothetical protein